jgi:opacity protein-like surface antigen
MRCLALAMLCFCATAGLQAQSTDLGLTIGGNFVSTKTFDVSHSWVIQGSLAHRLFGAEGTGLYAELPIAAAFNNQPKTVSTVTNFHYSSLFVTPGVKLRIGTPLISPYVTFGVGAAHFSATNGLGGDTSAAFSYGGGADWNVLPHIGIRGELRDYNSGIARFSLSGSGRQHNTFLTVGAFVSF